MRLIIALISLCLAFPTAANAQDREVPYWASLRAEEVNMRVGPSPNYPVEWVYRRPGLPVKVVRLHEGWRLVQDPDGSQGWIVARLLNPERGAIVTGDGLADIRDEPDGSSTLLWRAQAGVVGKLGDCREGWCRIDIGGRRGWIRENRLWGAGEP